MKGRKHRDTGGANLAADDLKTKNQKYTYESKVNDEAEERKRGGKVKKEAGKIEGVLAKHHAGRKPRKNGGRTGSDSNPFTSARHGTQPSGHKTEADMD